MDWRWSTTADRSLPLAFLALFLGLIVVPVVRARLRTGEWGVVVHRSPDPAERFVGRALGAALLAVALWVLAYAALGPRALGVRPSPPVVHVVGWILYALSFAIAAVGQSTMGPSWRIGIDDRPTALVAAGIYRWVRHPIYTGLIGLTLALAMLAPSLWTLLAIPFVLLLVGVQARLEEQHQERLHGEAWRTYARATGRFLPKLG